MYSASLHIPTVAFDEIGSLAMNIFFLILQAFLSVFEELAKDEKELCLENGLWQMFIKHLYLHKFIEKYELAQRIRYEISSNQIEVLN